MTLTRQPCEIDKMSLFQDLKLKRRKVDSRCSSDGESAAETSTSSPDLVCPPSPKMAVSDPQSACIPPPSPTYSPPNESPSATERADSGVFDGGGSPPPPSQQQPPPPSPTTQHRYSPRLRSPTPQMNNNNMIQQSSQTMRCATPQSIIRSSTPQSTIINNNNRSPTPQNNNNQNHQNIRSPTPQSLSLPSPGQNIRSSAESPTITHQNIRSITPQNTAQMSLQMSRSLRSPNNNNNNIHSPTPPISQQSVIRSPQNQTSTITQNPQNIHHLQYMAQHSPSSPKLSPHQLMRSPHSPQQSQQTHVIRESPIHVMQQTHSPGLKRSPVSSPCDQLNPIGNVGRLWSNQISNIGNQGARINGVKPELIGGGLMVGDMKPPTRVGTVRQTPTVIMGEAGGVRTMIWSQPAPIQQSQQPNLPQNVPPSIPTTQITPYATQENISQIHASTSNWTASNPEENAAVQMLLHLGQDRVGQKMQGVQSSGVALNMERLWAGDLTQLPANQQLHALNLSSQQQTMANLGFLGGQKGIESQPDISQPADDDEQPMICMICEDKATGLHYGIITCEGCKGFFKRTVQNRRVYTCVADGNCEITKAQRNRCQYCRFKKCIEQGMVLQAVREDRMPGGRNSGAVYNLYKVKYKKHKKATAKQTQAAQQTHLQHTKQTQLDTKPAVSIVKMEPQQHVANGTILKTALTNPSEVIHLRQRLDSAVSSSRDRNMSLENALAMVQTLVECDEFEDIATLRNVEELLDHKSDLSEKLCQIGDSIVYKLVQWTKRLPFYLELPVEVHTRLLTHKWHELLVLTTSAYQSMRRQWPTDASDLTEEVANNLQTLQGCLAAMMGRSITMEQLRQDVGLMVEKITHVTLMFRRVRLTMHEYVCLKVIAMLGASSQGTQTSQTGVSELETIHERYTACLKALTTHTHPQQPARFHELLVRLPEVQSAAALLLESKMFYVPFLLNSAIQR